MRVCSDAGRGSKLNRTQKAQYLDWVDLYAALAVFGATVKPLITDPPKSGQPGSVQRTAHLTPIDFIIELIHFEPPRSGHLSTPNNGH